MNEQLRFSWGHIIAFFALIAISYISFVGCTYLTHGQFLTAGIVMVVIDVVLLLIFIGMQMAKSTAHKFSRWIWVERVCLLISPLVFIATMTPYFHFWTIHSQNDEIVETFSNAINASKQMFSDYDDYANERIADYEFMLGNVISDKSSNPQKYAACGFVDGKEYLQKENMVKALRLQLISCNYDSLKTEALKWIDNSCEGANTWNVFLIGNIQEIKEAIHGWNKQLSNYAENKLSNEEIQEQVASFSDTSHSLSLMDSELDSLTTTFTEMRFPNIGSIVIALILYFALLFPYLLQDRHTKSVYSLLGMKKGFSSGGGIEINPHYESEDVAKTTYNGETAKQEDDDDYASFTM